MFGLGTISWGEFSRYLIFGLIAWYLGLILLGWLKQKHRGAPHLYEGNYDGEGGGAGGIQPISIASNSFPRELTPYPNEDIPLEIVYYEETGLEEGYLIDEFANTGSPLLPIILPEIEYQ